MDCALSLCSEIWTVPTLLCNKNKNSPDQTVGAVYFYITDIYAVFSVAGVSSAVTLRLIMICLGHFATQVKQPVHLE